MERVYNFSAGPSMLPEAVLKKAADQMVNYEGCGMSVMEMSHRSSWFQDIFDSTKAKLKKALPKVGIFQLVAASPPAPCAPARQRLLCC